MNTTLTQLLNGFDDPNPPSQTVSVLSAQLADEIYQNALLHGLLR